MIQTSRRGITWAEFTTALTLALIILMVSVPPWMRAQEARRRASTAVRMRETAAALEAYHTDHDSYPPCAIASGPPREYASQQIWQQEKFTIIASGVPTANSFASTDSGAIKLVTFRLPVDREDGHSLTTPVAYLPRLYEDPFSRTAGASFGYFCHGSNLGWILYSLGPDRDENAPGGPGDINAQVERIYDLNREFPYLWKPRPPLIEMTYDPSNGLLSNGDIIRFAGQ